MTSSTWSGSPDRAIDSYELFTTFPVQKFDDVKGKKIATAGAALQWLRGTGATPVQSNMTLYYNNAKTGVIDGFIMFPSSIPGMKYPEAAPFMTKVGFGAQYAAALIINKDVYASCRRRCRRSCGKPARPGGRGRQGAARSRRCRFRHGARGFPGAKAFTLPREGAG